MDNTNKGMLGRDQFERALGYCHMYLNNQELETVMAHYDLKHDGTASYEEFLTGMKGSLNARRKQLIKTLWDAVGAGAPQLPLSVLSPLPPANGGFALAETATVCSKSTTPSTRTRTLACWMVWRLAMRLADRCGGRLTPNPTSQQVAIDPGEPQGPFFSPLLTPCPVHGDF